MERKPITIEEIKSNPNLDLTETMNLIAKDNKWDNDDLKGLAIAIIVREYNFWLKNRKNISPRTDELLDKILNTGHILSQSEKFEMICTDPEKTKKYLEYEKLIQSIKDKNGITLDNYNKLSKTIGFDPKTAELIKMGLEGGGKIISSYKNPNSIPTNNYEKTDQFLRELAIIAGLIESEAKDNEQPINSKNKEESPHR